MSFSVMPGDKFKREANQLMKISDPEGKTSADALLLA